MPIQTQIKFKDFLKAVIKHGNQKFGKLKKVNKSGSARRFDLYKDENDDVPFRMWSVHESEYVYSDDFKKTYEGLGITKDELEGICGKRKK